MGRKAQFQLEALCRNTADLTKKKQEEARITWLVKLGKKKK